MDHACKRETGLMLCDNMDCWTSILELWTATSKLSSTGYSVSIPCPWVLPTKTHIPHPANESDQLPCSKTLPSETMSVSEVWTKLLMNQIVCKNKRKSWKTHELFVCRSQCVGELKEKGANQVILRAAIIHLQHPEDTTRKFPPSV